MAGANGFIGRKLYDRLVGLGHYVLGLDNFSTSTFSKHDDRNIVEENAKTVRSKDFDRIDWIINLAGIPFPKKYKTIPNLTFEESYLVNKALMDVALAKNAKYLLASSSEIYGELINAKETDSGSTPTMSLRSAYIEGKRLAETHTFLYSNQYGLDAKIMRLFNVYGPGYDLDKDTRVVPTFIDQIHNNEHLVITNSARSFCYIDDCIDAILLYMESKNIPVINIGNDSMTTMYELKSLISIKSGISSVQHTTVDVEHGEPKVRCPNITKLRELGYSPKTKLPDGLELTIGYYNKTKKERNGFFKH